MDDEEAISQFLAITDATPDRAAQYLKLADGNLEQAVQLYFDTGGIDMGASLEEASASSTAATTRQPAPPPPSAEVVTIDSDEEDGGVPTGPSRSNGGTRTATPSHMEDDEAMARRLQQEMYGVGGSTGAIGGAEVDEEGVRAPVARTAETLAAPDYSSLRSDPMALNSAVYEQMLGRSRAPGLTRRPPGIFNQRPPTGASRSIWTEDADSEERRRTLARATGGESERSSKSSKLAEMYKPPYEIMSALPSWDLVRSEGKDAEKWIMVNVQDSEVFDSHVLNRDIWNNPQIRETIKENFVFKQYQKEEAQASDYIRFYFTAYQSSDAYPHIAIIDPRTGEQLKVWSGAPVPKSADFLSQLHEFLDRYSLNLHTKNPVANRKAEKSKELDVGKMTEEQMLEMAMQQSLAGGKTTGPRDHDPDSLTREALPLQEDTLMAEDAGVEAPEQSVGRAASSFELISPTNPHVEPAITEAEVTRIQFRHPGGRVIRRFQLHDPVRRIYEWLKAEPLPDSEGLEFELIFMGKNLIDSLDQTVQEAGLKNGSVMVDFLEAQP